MNIIGENPVIIVPYLIPIALVIAGIAFSISIFFVDFISEGIFTGFEPEAEDILRSMWSLVSLMGFFIILAIIFGIVADAFAIDITSNASKKKKVTLSKAWNRIGVGKILILIVVSIIAVILTVLGLLTLCIGALIVYVLLRFVYQGIVIDDLDIGASFSNSYNIAKNNFFDVLILVLIFIVIGIIFSQIPLIGPILNVLMDIYATVVYTVLYLDRK